MRNVNLSPLRCAAVILCACATGAVGQVTMQLIAPPPGPSLGGVYISPYTALIDGVPTTVICDDFTTEISTSTPPWSADVTNLASLSGETSPAPLKFDTTDAAQQVTGYDVAAYLAIQILQAQEANDVTAQGDLSFALWGVFDPTSSDPDGPLSGNWITGTDLTNATTDLGLAEAAVAGGWTPSDYSVTIYTPSPTSAAQEFLTVTAPEASTPVLLSVDLLGLALVIAFFRRRSLRTGS